MKTVFSVIDNKTKRGTVFTIEPADNTKASQERTKEWVLIMRRTLLTNEKETERYSLEV